MYTLQSVYRDRLFLISRNLKKKIGKKISNCCDFSFSLVAEDTLIVFFLFIIMLDDEGENEGDDEVVVCVKFIVRLKFSYLQCIRCTSSVLFFFLGNQCIICIAYYSPMSIRHCLMYFQSDDCVLYA